MKLGIEITSGVGSEDLRTLRKLVEAARRQGHEVRVFAMDHAVFELAQLRGLPEAGVPVAVCASNAYSWGVPKVEGLLWGGQNDWAEAVYWADRVVVLG